MAAPTVVAATASESGGNRTDITLNTPLHSEGDLVFVAITQDNPTLNDIATFGAPAGWAFLYNEVPVGGAGDGQATFALAYKVAGASEPAQVLFTSSNEERIHAIAWSVTDHDGLDVWATTPLGGEDDVAPFPSVTTTVNDTLVFAVVATDLAPVPHGIPSGYTLVRDYAYTSSGATSVWYRAVATAGQETPGDTSFDSAQEYATVTFAVAPSSSAPLHNLSADDLTGSAVVLGNPTLESSAGPIARSLSAAPAALGQPAIGQMHVLGTSGLEAAAFALGAPALIAEGSPQDLTASALVLGQPALGQMHLLAASALTVGAIVLGAPVLAQEIHDLAAGDWSLGAPVLGEPLFGHIHSLAASSLAAAAPLLGQPGMGQAHDFVAAGLAASPAIVGRPHLNLVVWHTPAERTLKPEPERRVIAAGGEVRLQPVAAERRIITA